MLLLLILTLNSAQFQNFTQLHVLTLAARSYVLLVVSSPDPTLTRKKILTQHRTNQSHPQTPPSSFLTLVIKEFRCYEAKIEESEKAHSRWCQTKDTSALSHQSIPLMVGLSTNQNNVLLTKAHPTMLKHLPSTLGTAGILKQRVCLLHTIIPSNTQQIGTTLGDNYKQLTAVNQNMSTTNSCCCFNSLSVYM